ncbi:MFS transporter [Silvimonas sp.]|uniref:MFS transporter n=1 Tax=Silvimonas sp. TaxID=2650811 RepID=UPI00284074A2|nr:MFS transporter [Silvimonas sp.]MDR3426612.1 MFS transporter [Silvimonas sp.]
MKPNDTASSTHWHLSCRATRLLFLLTGIANAAWAAMVPFAKLRLNLNDAALGSILLALGCGAMLAMPLTGVLMKRYGSARVLTLAGSTMVISVPLLAIAPSPIWLAVALFLFGALLGAVDVTMNNQAVFVEAQAGRPLMSSFHGLFSLGGLLGGVGIAALLKTGMTMTWCALAVGAAFTLATLLQSRHLLPHAQTEPQHEQHDKFRFPPSMVWLLGMLCFFGFLTEGAMLDWGAVFLRFERGVSEAGAGLGYAAFSVAMAAGRLTGDFITHRLGPVKVVLVGGLLAAAGLVTIVAAPWVPLSLLGFVLVGMGASNVVPVLFSASAKIPGVPASTALPLVTMCGYTGMLAGPAAIGFLSRATSLPIALGGTAVLMAFVAFNARIVKPRAN